jgi:hypothetical protein
MSSERINSRGPYPRAGLPPIPTAADVAKGRLRALMAFEAAYRHSIDAEISSRNAERVALAAGVKPSDVEAVRRMVKESNRQQEGKQW